MTKIKNLVIEDITEAEAYNYIRPCICKSKPKLIVDKNGGFYVQCECGETGCKTSLRQNAVWVWNIFIIKRFLGLM